MNREISLNCCAGHVLEIVEARDDSRQVRLLSAEPGEKMIVGIGVASELKPVQRRRTPVAGDSPKEEIRILPLRPDVSVLSASGELPVLAPGELGIGVEPRINEGPNGPGLQLVIRTATLKPD